ncbi:Fic family protein [Sporosarcina sp. GW1-11]|uniref:Fic family protein n=1 Tax=Sporosarcina sp. GW1-11 TaxID=2899126 RepID=UPI00294BF20E|nr:Fic family protein [Sporosarcina sp. GW1-11]MDV6377158.1 Fic family protein [Sporosarcina sp. GW1-11]
MKHLYKVFNESSSSDFSEVYKQRIHNENVEILPMAVKPLHHNFEYPIYYLPTSKIIDEISNIYKLNQQIMRIFGVLPGIAQNSYIFDCLVAEMQNTNEIEGVRSSREELARSVRELNKGSKKKLRFSSMVNSYTKLLSNDLDLLESAEDIRKIYDYVVLEEISAEDRPDGKIFRKDATCILKKSGTGKEIHRGITPESKIIDHITTMINFLKSNDYHELIKIAIAHYYFGYIHPFYDGNGRTSRFISSMYLNDSLSELAAISLSRGCNKYNKKYLEAFENTNKVGNRGEMNNFIDTFLEILSNSLQDMIAELKEKLELLNSFNDKIISDSRLDQLDEKYRDMLFILAQNFYFSEDKGLSILELKDITNKSEKTIRTILKTLIELEIVDCGGNRPKVYSVSDLFFD